MAMFSDALVAVLCLTGTALIFLTGVGLVRFPDVYCRMHAAGKAGTLGVVLLVLGATVHFAGTEQDVWMRGLLAVGFQFLTAPAATHLLAQAAYLCEYPLSARTVVDELRAYLPATETPALATTGIVRKEHPMISKILVGLENTPNTEVAIGQAVELARRHHAALTGIAVIDGRKVQRVGMAPVGAGVYAKRLREYRLAATEDSADRSIMAFESACKTADIPYDIRRVLGDPLTMFPAHARHHDLTVLATGFLLYHDVLNEPADSLNRLLERNIGPVLAVAPECKTIRRALIAYDGSRSSTTAMRQFVQLHPWPDISAEIIGCEEQARGIKDLLNEAAAFCRSHGVDVDVHTIAGSATDRLPAYAAEWDADLIVLGSPTRYFPRAWHRPLRRFLQNKRLSLFLHH